MRSVREGALTEWFAQQRDQLSVSVVGAWDPDSRFARSCEAEIFHRAFGNTVEDLEREHGKYDARSFYLFVTERGSGDAAGFMRVTVPSRDGFSKSLDDVVRYWHISREELRIHGESLLNFGRVLDIATLGVAPPWQGSGRSGAVTLLLYRAFVNAARVVEGASAVAILDSRLYRASNAEFVKTWDIFEGAEPLAYLGCPRAYPVACIIREWESRMKLKKADLREVIFGGVELSLMQAVGTVIKRIEEREPVEEILLDRESTAVLEPEAES